MAYNKALAARVRHILSIEQGITERSMFGGLAFFCRRNMCVGVWQDALIVRLGEERCQAALSQEGAAPFQPAGTPFRGWVLVDAESLDSPHRLAEWIEQGLSFARTLPPK